LVDLFEMYDDARTCQTLNLCRELTSLLQFTIDVQKSHHQHQCTLKFECKIMCCLSELIFTLLHVGSSIQNASDQFDSCIHLDFVNSIFHPTPQTNSNGIRSGDSHSPLSVTIQNWTDVRINY